MNQLKAKQRYLAGAKPGYWFYFDSWLVKNWRKNFFLTNQAVWLQSTDPKETLQPNWKLFMVSFRLPHQ